MWQLLRRAPKRFARSLGYCRDAFVELVREEESFKLELIAVAVVAAGTLLCGWPWWKKAALLAGCVLIPMVEALNSAVEDLCDLVSKDKNPRIKAAKDKAALAVFITIIANALLLAALMLIDD